MTDKALADILARTYAHRVTAFRPLTEGEERLCEAAPCALSRSEHTSAPTPPSLSAAWPEALYRLTLYTRPELAFRLGDPGGGDGREGKRLDGARLRQLSV